MGLLDRIKQARKRARQTSVREKRYREHGFTRGEARRAARESQSDFEKKRDYKAGYRKVKAEHGKRAADDWGKQWKKQKTKTEREKKQRQSKTANAFGRAANTSMKTGSGFGNIGFGGPGFGGSGGRGRSRRGGGGGTNWGKGPF